MGQIWRVWSRVGYGAFEYLGDAAGESFKQACESLANTNPDFARDFDPPNETLQDCPLVPLERRVDGRQFADGESRDAVSDEPVTKNAD